MKDQLISFKTAKLAKERGFNWSSTYTYEKDYNKTIEIILYKAPTQSLLQKWLREVHNTHISIQYFLDHDLDNFEVYITNNHLTKKKYLFDTYEQALEAGLLEGLNLIK